jgi:uncharacterized protein YfaS (alpha-2-macroglobulin family)
VATRSEQPELPRRLPAALLVALSAALAAQPALAQYEPSGYEPQKGEPFFLLSDKSWGSGEVPQVRLEVSTDFGMSAIEDFGGVDIALYRVPRPLPFLEAQKNLHRVKTDAVPAEEGLSNTLAHLWDRWYGATRRAFQRIFSSGARQAVTAAAPDLKTQPMPPTSFRQPSQFRAIPGLDLRARFRYPVHQAAPIPLPANVKLEGSSSGWTPPAQGNVMVPLGRLAPGLYLVEAALGGYRATTLVFVSDTVAITKASAREMVVWAADRSGGRGLSGVEIAWTDGAGVLESGTSDSQGLVRFSHEAPERSYVLGVDPQGGAFISENFYYDSEIYDTKLYAFTDRPLYRPGDKVYLKAFAREFRSARDSVPAQDGDVDFVAYDPNGVPGAHETLRLKGDEGGDSSFLLPEGAEAGGWELRMRYRGTTYSAAFRVAEYSKPHFEIVLVPDKSDFKVGEAVTGRLQLRYPDGRPVVGASVELSVRSQRTTMADGQLAEGGAFPLKLDAQSLASDPRGEVTFSLPAAPEPSRYVITALVTDGAASRVRTTRELLVERGRSTFTLKGDRQWSEPGSAVSWKIVAALPASQGEASPRRWEWVRLEDRKTDGGALEGGASLKIAFAEAGSYTVRLRDEGGNIVAATSHFVSGGVVAAPTGSIEIVPNRPRYLPGETAEILVTFPVAQEEALLTLERDHVEEGCLLSRGGPSMRVSRVTPTEWRVRIPVGPSFAPNITFSVAYVRNGEYVFENQGLAVVLPKVEVSLTPEKGVFAPGDTVQVDVRTSIDGKGASAVVAVGVVDEMVYVLQPETAPTIEEFFYHFRRNNVRTSSSQSFISYDLATSRSKAAPLAGGVSERRVKLLERPRRDEVDTAFWQAGLRTDASGRGRFSFVMPDALTRWRITGRALSAGGVVGQKASYVRSEKAVYLKWTSPAWMRDSDSPVASLAAFNETPSTLKANLAVQGPGIDRHESLSLKPGMTVIPQPLGSLAASGELTASLSRGGKVEDALATPIRREPLGWRGPQSETLELAGRRTPIGLPADARDVRLRVLSGAGAHFARIASDLMDYPYGCVEQTASRMIPMALAIEGLGPGGAPSVDRLRQQLNGHRLRLAYMAGPKATFTWWGGLTADDPFLTPYAYYADFLSARALGIALPKDHASRLLDVYAESGHLLPEVQRATILNLMQEMGLPVQGLTTSLLESLRATARKAPTTPADVGLSSLLGEPEAGPAQGLALLLAERLVKAQGGALPAALGPAIPGAADEVRHSALGAALLLASGRLAPAEADRILASVSVEAPTMERALALAFLHTTLGGSAAAPLELPAPWQKVVDARGSVSWRFGAAGLPGEVLLAEPPPPGTSVAVDFTTMEVPKARAATVLARRFYRLVKGKTAEEGWRLEPMGAGEAFSTNALYLDEVEVSGSGAPLRYGILEVPLPPGATVESTTWGLSVPGPDGKLQALERARDQPTAFGYAVPLDPIRSGERIRHLVRFAEPGTFRVPSARLYRMYAPAEKAFEADAGGRALEVQ